MRENEVELELLEIPRLFREAFATETCSLKSSGLFVRRTRTKLIEQDRGTEVFYKKRAAEVFGRLVGYVLREIRLHLVDLFDPHYFDGIIDFARQVHFTLITGEPYYSIVKLKPDASSINDKPYRDHILHPIVVYLIGYQLLKSQVNTNGTLLRHLAGMLSASEIGHDSLRFAGLKSMNSSKWEATLQEAWCIAALCHDLAYSLEAGVDLENYFLKRPFLEPISKHFMSLHRNFVDILSRAPIRATRKELVHTYFVREAEATLIDPNNKRGALDHGQVCACILLRRCLEPANLAKLEGYRRAALFIAMTGIFRHDSMSKPKNIDKLITLEDPFTQLLCLCDLLAEIRLVWQNVSFEKRGTHATSWRFDVWLPFTCLIGERLPNVGEWKWTFGKADEKDLDRSPYSYELAAGVGLNPYAAEKRDQYGRILDKLFSSTVSSSIQVGFSR